MTYNQKKRAMIQAVKLERGCEHCGDSNWTEATELHFHHTGTSPKSFNISREIHNKGMATLLAEIDKCSVLCFTCHIETESYGRH